MELKLRPVTFEVRATPKASPRPRARIVTTKAGKQFVQVYAGKTDKEWKAMISAAARAAWSPRILLEGVPIRLHMYFTFLRPKSDPKREHHIVKPDLDNLQKSVKDAITDTKAIWHDDKQVTEVWATKRYGTWAGVIVEISFP